MEELYNFEKRREEIKKLQKLQRGAVKLHDMSHIQTIHSWIVDKLCEIDVKENSQLHKHLFIFIILLLYFPGALFGDKAPHGLRRYVAESLKVKSCQRISDNTRIVLFLYKNDKSFKNKADYLYAEMLFRIELNGLK